MPGESPMQDTDALLLMGPPSAIFWAASLSGPGQGAGRLGADGVLITTGRAIRLNAGVVGLLALLRPVGCTRLSPGANAGPLYLRRHAMRLRGAMPRPK